MTRRKLSLFLSGIRFKHVSLYHRENRDPNASPTCIYISLLGAKNLNVMYLVMSKRD